MHPVNLGSNKGRGIIIYIHSSIDNCVTQINPDIQLTRNSIRWRGWSTFCYLHRSPSPTSTSEKNNANLINLKYLSGKKYCHQCFIGNFNFTNINWFRWIKQPNEERKEAQFIETIRDCYICLHLLEPTRSRSRSTNTSSLIDLVLANEVT